MQRKDFVELFKIMHGLPVTIRLLDPPLHEFLPKTDEEIAEVAEAMKVDPALLRDRVIALTESNPMLGHRGCRLLDHLSGDRRDADARDPGGGGGGGEGDGRAGDAGDHGAARRHAQRARPRARDDRPHREGARGERLGGRAIRSAR